MILQNHGLSNWSQNLPLIFYLDMDVQSELFYLIDYSCRFQWNIHIERPEMNLTGINRISQIILPTYKMMQDKITIFNWRKIVIEGMW